MMRFLVDADMPRATVGLVSSYGHDCVDVRDVGYGGRADSEIAMLAAREQRCIIKCDWGFADVRAYPPSSHAGIVVLGVPEHADRESKLEVLRVFLEEEEVVTQMAGRLAIVEKGRIRLRPPLTT